MIVNGLVEAVTKPVEFAVGTADPHGKANTCQEVATEVSGFAGCIQFKTAEVDNTLPELKVIGFLHVGGGPQAILLTQPAAPVVPFEVKTKVNSPVAEDAV